jgi:hypothetical protein
MSGEEGKPRSTRGSSSKNSSPDRGPNRTISGRHLDDQYHDHETYANTKPEEEEDEDEEEEEGESGETDDDADLSGNESTAEEPGAQKQPSREDDGGDEVRDAPASEKDLEAGNLEKAKTTSSKRSRTRDPNLVTWDAPDDPENPKNWTLGRKWAATLVGESGMFSSVHAMSNSYY